MRRRLRLLLEALLLVRDPDPVLRLLRVRLYRLGRIPGVALLCLGRWLLARCLLGRGILLLVGRVGRDRLLLGCRGVDCRVWRGDLVCS